MKEELKGRLCAGPPYCTCSVSSWTPVAEAQRFYGFQPLEGRTLPYISVESLCF